MTEPTKEMIEAARDVISAAEPWLEERGADVASRVARAALLAASRVAPAPVMEPSEEAMNAFGSAFDPDFARKHARRVRDGLRRAYAIDFPAAKES